MTAIAPACGQRGVGCHAGCPSNPGLSVSAGCTCCDQHAVDLPRSAGVGVVRELLTIRGPPRPLVGRSAGDN